MTSPTDIKTKIDKDNLQENEDTVTLKINKNTYKIHRQTFSDDDTDTDIKGENIYEYLLYYEVENDQWKTRDNQNTIELDEDTTLTEAINTIAEDISNWSTK